MFVGRDGGRGNRFLVVNRLKGRVLNMRESQHERFGKSRTNVVENSDGDDQGRVTYRGMSSNS